MIGAPKIENWSRDHGRAARAPFNGGLSSYRLRLATVNLHSKFVMSISTHYEDRKFHG